MKLSFFQSVGGMKKYASPELSDVQEYHHGSGLLSANFERLFVCFG